MIENFDYPILTPEQQYENLEQKGLIMDQDKNEIVSFLTHHSYFKIMLYFRPYWSVDTDNIRKFNKGTTRSRILQDYHFDHDLRILLFSYIIHIENSFKNTLCQYSCQKLGNVWREDVNNFHDPQVFVESIQPVLSEILLGKSKYDHVQKYIDRGYLPKNPPFWNMLEVFTVGQVVKIYRYLSDTEIKKDIGKQYNLNESKLWSWMKTIVDARNICCHHNKLFDKKNRMITNVRAIDHMLDRRNNTIYHVCCLMYYLLNQIRPDHQFIIDLEALLSNYTSVDTTFPENWKELWK